MSLDVPTAEGVANDDTSRGKVPDANARYHVAFYIPSMGVGGAQKVTATIANGLVEAGHRVDIVVSYGGGEFTDALDDAVRVVDLETPRLPFVGVLASVPALRRYLNEEQPDVLIGAMMHANVVSVLADAASGAETTVALTEHNTVGVRHGRKEALTARIAARLYGSADSVIAVSEGVANSIATELGTDPESIAVLYNPIEVDDIAAAATHPIAEQTPAREWLSDPSLRVLFTVGRLEAAKDLPTLLRAFARVHDERPETRLVVAGTGSKRDELESLASSLGIRERVCFPGYVENAYAYMGRADAFVLSSRHEGLPTVLLEALACGLPIASTDCPSGPHEILDGGELGPLVPVGDDEALAEAIGKVLDDPVEDARLHSRAEDFSVQAVTTAYESFVASLVDDR
ncbi:glycosyltransferase [Haloferax larsenii]|uniref:Glycosyltransferase involved in cell wall bisynthesis n=1 Tax=Haloferax larsenii TaxID=302484 RepID=A0A1H7PY85_HALLR|nr:glycosyltransferase [Haloferax larsenii]SEL40702.1 Glycosyltransferase involved in cell wall bisynthesis [Haloferax larsenii]